MVSTWFIRHEVRVRRHTVVQAPQPSIDDIFLVVLDVAIGQFGKSVGLLIVVVVISGYRGGGRGTRRL